MGLVKYCTQVTYSETFRMVPPAENRICGMRGDYCLFGRLFRYVIMISFSSARTRARPQCPFPGLFYL
jgi:hypothetical protein